jgi:hypothetical protein
MNKANNLESKKPPLEIVDAVKLIEKWTSEQTDRDDWVIGGIGCRAGFERLLRMHHNLLIKLKDKK